MSKVKEKAPVGKQMKEKVKAAPKELLRRGLSDGTQRLRDQLRDTAQQGQRDRYGGDQIEDTAWAGSKWGKLGIQKLLKQKRDSRTRIADHRASTSPGSSDSPAEPLPWDNLAPPEPPRDTVPQGGTERVKIKTRETVSRTSAGSASPKIRDQSDIFHPRSNTAAPAAKTPTSFEAPVPKVCPEQVRIKTREVVAHADPVEASGPMGPRTRPQGKISPDLFEPPVPKERPNYTQIRTRGPVVERRSGTAMPDKIPLDLPLHGRRRIRTQVGSNVPEDMELSASVPTPQYDWPTIKTKNIYIQQKSSMTAEQPPQALELGRGLSQRKRAQKLVEDRTRGRQSAPGNFSVPQTEQNDSPVPRPAVGQSPISKKETSSFTIPRARSSAKGEPVLDGKVAVKAVHPNTKAHKNAKIIGRTAGRSMKNAERTYTQVIKARGHGTKVIEQTAQAVPQAHRGTVQAVRTTKKAAAVTTRSTAKAGTAALRAAVRALRNLMAALTAGGGVVISVVLVVCLVGLIVASPSGIFFLDGSGDPDAVSPASAVALIDQEYEDTLASLEAEGSYDSVEVIGGPPSWSDVFAVFAVKTTTGDALNVAVLDADRMERLRAVFWDMTKITTAISTVNHPATDDSDAWTETTLTITVTPRTPDDMRVFYAFTDEQNAALDELLASESQDMWSGLFYGGSGEIVSVALSQLGNVGGRPYWSWYGFSSRVSWCACFVSWCANECGYIDAGVIPKFSSCSSGVSWFKHRGLWQDKDYEPHPGDIIFFDWDSKGSSGPQNGSPDHVGIVERVENGTVYTVEGNSSDRCRQRSYSVGHYEIYGYGTPILN